MHTIPVAGTGESCLGPVFLTFYKFGSIQFSGQNKVTVSEMSVNQLL